MPTTSTFAATFTAGSERSAAWVHLAGDVDLAADNDLDAIVERLSRVRPQAVCIDLADVTFAGTTLINFLLRAKAASDSGAPLVLWRTPPVVRLILDAVDFNAIVVLGNSAPTALPPAAYARRQ